MILKQKRRQMMYGGMIGWKRGDVILHLAGLSMFLSTAVQLRFGPVGVGELSGMGAVGMCLLMNMPLRPHSAFFIKSLFIVCIAVFFGGVISLFTRGKDIEWFDFIGMVYAFLVAAAVMVAADRSRAPLSSLASYLLLLPIVQVVLLLYSFLAANGLSIWFAEDGPTSTGLPIVNRFVGWAAFPNQLGIAISGLPFVILLVMKRRLKSRIYCTLALACTLVCAGLIMSNTVFIAWLLGLAFVVTARRVFSFRTATRWTPAVRLMSLLAVPTLAIAVVMNPQFFDFLFVKGEDADLNGRLPLWTASIESWARSPLLGLGPGAHAQLMGEDVAAESHLLFLDLLTQGGLIALFGLLGIFFWSFRCAVKSRDEFLIGLVVAVTIEALAHNTQRHPMFWLYLVLPAIILQLEKRHPQEVGHDR
jgi:O-antigen ligase